MRSFVLVLTCASLCLSGCGEQAATPPPSASASPAAVHAAASVAPGSYDDWCGEHQVPESLCARCNASLIPAFKATKDWCAEHNLPESQCLKCNPTLKITRPAKGAGK